MTVLVIAGTIFRRMIRDRTAIFFVIFLPFFIILVIGSATKNLSSNRLPLGLVNRSSGALTTELVRSFEDSRTLRTFRVTSDDALRKALRRGVYSAGVIIPKNYETNARSGRLSDVAFVADEVRPPIVVRAAVGAIVARQGAVLQAADFAAAHTGQSFEQSLSQARAASRAAQPVAVRIETVGQASKTQFIVAGFNYTAPSQLVLFVFLTSIAASGFVIADRRQGLISRIYAAPATARSIVLGYGLGRFINAAFQAVYIVALGILIFGVHFGDPLSAFVLITLYVAVSTAFAMLAGTVFRTPEQASALVPPIGIAMAMLAGCMWPRFIMPVPMQRIGQLFPQAWAMDAFIKLIDQGTGLGSILPQLAVLAAFLLAILPLATWRLRRSIVA